MHAEDSPQTSNSRVDWILGALLVLLTWLIYLPVRQHGFVWYDDPSYLLDNEHVNQGFSLENLRWAFGAAHSANWHPLTWLSHMLDCELFGLWAGGHHLMSVGIHSLNALLCFLVLRAATGARLPSLICAAFFALHPLRVQSVAWASERKDLLAGLFFFLCLSSYIRYVKRPSPRGFALVALCLAMGLMTKPMLVSMPLVFLLFDHWPLGRLAQHSTARLVLEKWPFFVLVLLSIVVTVIAQDEGGAFRFANELPMTERLPHAASSLLWYVQSSFWPVQLACFYPHPALVLSDWEPWISSILPFVLCALGLGFAARYARCCPELLFGALWMLIMLLPVIGIVQVGEQAWADRYAYLPTIGLYIAVIWPLYKLALGNKALGWTLGAAALACSLALGLRSMQELPHWKSTESLAQQALRVSENNYVAHLGLGNEHLARGEWQQAEEQFAAAERIRPDNTELVLSYSDLYIASGKQREALELYRQALRSHPRWSLIRMRLGIALAKSGQTEAAIQELELALAESPGNIDLIYNLALAYLQDEQPALALPHLNTCLERSARFFEARIARGEALLQLKDYAAAKRDLTRGARVAPELAAARLALVLASAPEESLRHAGQALEWAHKAIQLRRDGASLEALAAAQAANGRFDEAQATQLEALELLPRQQRDAARARLLNYRAGEGYRLPR